MNLIFENFMVRDRSMIELKNSFIKIRLKLFSVAYGIWIVVSAVSAYMQPHKYASYFTDLPNNLRNISPFVLSLAYLTLFIPAVALTVLFALIILFFVVRSVYKK